MTTGKSSELVAFKAPTQKRSRDRQERILSVAQLLIAAKGSDNLRMSEIARDANISIGSLYQYFPEKGSILCALAQRYHAACIDAINLVLPTLLSPQSFAVGYGRLVDDYYQLLLSEPAMCDIWSSLQTEPRLRVIEMKASQECSAILAQTIMRIRPNIGSAAAHTKALLFWTLGNAAARLALERPREEGLMIMEAYKEFSQRELATLLSE